MMTSVSTVFSYYYYSKNYPNPTELSTGGCLQTKLVNLFDNNNYTECLCAELENVKFGKHFCAFFFFNFSRWLLSDYVKVR